MRLTSGRLPGERRWPRLQVVSRTQSLRRPRPRAEVYWPEGLRVSYGSLSSYVGARRSDGRGRARFRMDEGRDLLRLGGAVPNCLAHPSAGPVRGRGVVGRRRGVEEAVEATTSCVAVSATTDGSGSKRR